MVRKLFILLVSFSLCSCLPILDLIAGKTLDDIKQKGRLVAITEYNANSYFLYKGTPLGFEYELLKSLARELGVELEIRVTKDSQNLIHMLNSGDGDIIAANLIMTNQRVQEFEFTEPISETRQVLIQKRSRKPLRNVLNLIGKEVTVNAHSVFYRRLLNLQEEIGGDINLNTKVKGLSTEGLIRLVVEKKTGFTVADENTARINKAYYPSLDIATELSFPQRIGWVVRNRSPELKKAINDWLKKIKKNGVFRNIYAKYYSTKRSVHARGNVEYNSRIGGKISIYDDQIKAAAESIDWDWRFLAALIYQESRFNPKARSWAGAMGLMQLMPATARMLKVRNPYEPNQNIRGGTRFLAWLEKQWEKKIPDLIQRKKFILASYNAGYGHITDAIQLAKKYGKKTDVWDNNVELYVKLLENPRYYRDPVVKYGYCRGDEPVNYVKSIFRHYENYQNFLQD